MIKSPGSCKIEIVAKRIAIRIAVSILRKLLGTVLFDIAASPRIFSKWLAATFFPSKISRHRASSETKIAGFHKILVSIGFSVYNMASTARNAAVGMDTPFQQISVRPVTTTTLRKSHEPPTQISSFRFVSEAIPAKTGPQRGDPNKANGSFEVSFQIA